MTAIVNFGTGKLAIVETWTKGEERVNLLRSYGECPEVQDGHYVFNDVTGMPLFSGHVDEARREATRLGYTRHVGNSRIVEGLLTHQSVEVLWWKHDLAKRASFIRDFDLGNPREFPLEESDLVILSNTGKSVTSEHGHCMVYYAASRTVLDRAHPRCRLCLGTGITTLSHFESRSDSVCSCVHGRSYMGIRVRTLKEVRLDRYHVVVMVADHGRDSLVPLAPNSFKEVEAELIGKYTTREAAEAEAEKRRLEPRFQPGSRYYSNERGLVVGVRVVDHGLPDWA